MDLRSKIMGRQLTANLPRIKHIYNSYSNGSNALYGYALQYTVPTGKTARINFDYATSLRASSYIDTFAFTLFATKKTSNPQHHSPIALGRFKRDGSQSNGQMVQFKPWWNFSEAAGNKVVSAGSYNFAQQGVSSRYIESAFSGNNNQLSSSSGNTIKNSYPQGSTYDPYTGTNGDGAPCDAVKDYMCPEGTQINFSYYCEHYGSPNVSGGNQVDISFQVEEMEKYA